MVITIAQKNNLFKYLKSLENMVKYEKCELKDIDRLKNEIYHIDYYLKTAKVIKKTNIQHSEYDCQVKDGKILLLSDKAKKLKSKYKMSIEDNYFQITPSVFGQIFRYRNSLYLNSQNSSSILEGNYNIELLDNFKTYRFTKV